MKLGRMPLILCVIIVIGVLGSTLAGYMVFLASSEPILRRTRVVLPRYPARTKPIRLVLLSDTHVSWPGNSPARLAQTVQRVNALHPDAVVLAGDFLATGIVGAYSYDAASGLSPLGRLEARYGVFAILGNHDDREPRAILAALKRAGVIRLDNEARNIGPIALVGISDLSSGHASISKSMRSASKLGGVPVVFTHSPDLIPALPKSVGLVLAGHTHCGQIRLPWIGAPFLNSNYGPKYGCSVSADGTHVGVTTAGLGTSSLPVRLGVPPDFWLIEVGGSHSFQPGASVP